MCTRVTEFSNERAPSSNKNIRNDARLKQIAQQYTFLNKSAVLQASASRQINNGKKQQIDNSRYKKVKCNNKVHVSHHHVSMKSGSFGRHHNQSQHMREDSREGFKTLPPKDTLRVNDSSLNNRSSQPNNNTFYMEAGPQFQHPSINQRITFHNFNP